MGNDVKVFIILDPFLPNWHTVNIKKHIFHFASDKKKYVCPQAEALQKKIVELFQFYNL